ncbi:MAG: hypothetical protein AB1656_21970 [Candidatus Omnitrophota bacterium]
MKRIFVVFSLILGIVHNAAFGDSYLLKTAKALDLQSNRLDAMKIPVEKAAQRLAYGGMLWAAGQESLVSELCGRAGGLMLVKRLGEAAPDKNDVVLIGQTPTLQVSPNLYDSGAFIVVFGENAGERDSAFFANYAKECGISPSLANIIPAWIFTGELIAALTRLGKMPIVYETIGLYGGYPRIDRFLKKGILWHEPNPVAPVAAGTIGRTYADTVIGFLKQIEKEERSKIDQASKWARQAKADGKRLFMYSMAHFPPFEVRETEIGKVFEPCDYNSGFTFDPPQEEYAAGDAVIHIGYQHPPEPLLKKARSAGARVVYADILSARDYRDDPGVIWIDPQWPWADGCVRVEGYDIPILPASAIVNTALAWEIYYKTLEP